MPGPIAAAFKTSLLGQRLEALPVAAAEPPPESSGEWSHITLTLQPYEIATLYLDLVPGRKQPRHLDAYRHVWATVHRAKPTAELSP